MIDANLNKVPKGGSGDSLNTVYHQAGAVLPSVEPMKRQTDYTPPPMPTFRKLLPLESASTEREITERMRGERNRIIIAAAYIQAGRPKAAALVMEGV